MKTEGYTLAELRVLVGCLGEQSPAWWSSKFFEQTAQAFLEPVFGRSVRQAQYQGVTEAAGLVHDEHIGVGRICHLFHMPERLEQAAADVIADPDSAGVIFKNTQEPELARTRLGEMASAKTAAAGPIVVGDVGQDVSDALAAMAGLYLDAFRQGIRTFPYLREV